MKLLPHHVAFFHQFGYLVVRQLFTTAEMQAIIGNFERTLAEFGPPGASARSDRLVLGPIQHLPEMSALLDHPGILGLAGGLLGDDFNYAGGDGRFYSGDTGWHPDGSWGQLFAAKIALYLDPLTRASGALRVIPGSHLPDHPIRRRLAAQGSAPLAGRSAARPMLGVQSILDECGIAGSDLPGVEALETTPGDAVMFNHDLFHASFGGGGRRRMFTLNLTRRAESEEDKQRLRLYLSHHSPGARNMAIGGMYFNPIIESATPGRLRHMTQCQSTHDEMFPQMKAALSHREQVVAMNRILHPETMAKPAAQA